jgi:hypothetical protein
LPKFYVQGMTQEKRQAFLAWLAHEDVDPAEVTDDGSFSVHNGRISGKRMLQDPEGFLILWGGKPVKVPFTRKQRNPLPEVLQ